LMAASSRELERTLTARETPLVAQKKPLALRQKADEVTGVTE
jgi:hypothetical protein